MIIREFLLVSVVFVCFVSCKKDYLKYTKKPDYITNMKPEFRPYFEAYDATLAVWDVPFEELYIPTTYGTAHVVITGPENGEALVLLHGMNASSTMWYPNIATLSEDYRVFAIDFILEPGKSFITKDMESTDQLVSWYHEIFTKLKLKSFHLGGASRGGWLAVNVALQKQDNIKSLVLLSPAQTFIWIRPSANLLKNIIYSFSSKERKMEVSLSTMSTNVENINKTYLEQYYLATEKDSINKFMVSMKPFNKREFQSLKMPVLVLVGDQDIINNNKSIRLAQDLIPNGQAAIIKNAGHFLSVDQASVVNKKIVNFLNSINSN